jgi:hypothetical protein
MTSKACPGRFGSSGRAVRDAARAAASRTIDRRDEEIALLMRRWSVHGKERVNWC